MTSRAKTVIIPCMSIRTLSLILLFSLGLLWGTGYSIARFVVTHGVPAASYSFWESFGPALLLSAAVFTQRWRHPQKTTPISPGHLQFYLVAGCLGIAIPNTCMYFAAGHLPAGLLAVTVNTVPVIAWPLALAVRLERFSLGRLIGLVLAVSGLLMLFAPRSQLPAAENWPWVLLALMTPLSFACCSLYTARFRPQQTGPVAIAAGMLSVATLLLVPLVITTGGLYLPHWPLNVTDGLIALEALLSSLGYIIFFELLRIAGPVYYSLVDTTVALTGLFWGYLLFDETFSLETGYGIFLILSGVLLVTRYQQREQRRSASSPP